MAFWERFHQACAERALSQDMKPPNSVYSKIAEMQPNMCKHAQREAEVRKLLTGAASSCSLRPLREREGSLAASSSGPSLLSPSAGPSSLSEAALPSIGGLPRRRRGSREDRPSALSSLSPSATTSRVSTAASRTEAKLSGACSLPKLAVDFRTGLDAKEPSESTARRRLSTPQVPNSLSALQCGMTPSRRSKGRPPLAASMSLPSIGACPSQETLETTLAAMASSPPRRRRSLRSKLSPIADAVRPDLAAL